LLFTLTESYVLDDGTIVYSLLAIFLVIACTYVFWIEAIVLPSGAKRLWLSMKMYLMCIMRVGDGDSKRSVYTRSRNIKKRLTPKFSALLSADKYRQVWFHCRAFKLLDNSVGKIYLFAHYFQIVSVSVSVSVEHCVV